MGIGDRRSGRTGDLLAEMRLIVVIQPWTTDDVAGKEAGLINRATMNPEFGVIMYIPH